MGCFCKSGYVRKSNATGSPCIKREKCKKKETTPKCKKNEEYLKCGSACVESCNYVPKICTEQCVPGCFCKSGFVRKSKATGSTCINRKKCPK